MRWGPIQNSYLLCILGGVATVYTVWRAGWKIWFHPLGAIGNAYTNRLFAGGVALFVYGLCGLLRRTHGDDV
jgi:hypothetical protein